MTTPTLAFDLTIRNGRISTDTTTFYADIGVREGVIVALEKICRQANAICRATIRNGADVRR